MMVSGFKPSSVFVAFIPGLRPASRASSLGWYGLRPLAVAFLSNMTGIITLRPLAVVLLSNAVGISDILPYARINF